MSMPSSSDEVATTQGSWPDLRSASICARCSLLTDPWWARATTGVKVPSWPADDPDWAMTCAGGRRGAGGATAPGRRLRRRSSTSSSSSISSWSRPGLGRLGLRPGRLQPLGVQLVEVRGQPLGEPAGVGEDDGRAVGGDDVEDAVLDVRPDRRRAGRLVVLQRDLAGRGGRAEVASCPRPARRCRGPTASPRAGPRCRRRTGRRGRPPRATPGAPWRTGRSAAAAAAAPDSCVRASSRSIETARWAPRLLPASTWTSSTITVRTERSTSRADEVSMRNSDSGVVMRMSGRPADDAAPLGRRGVAGAHADRDARRGLARRAGRSG